MALPLTDVLKPVTAEEIVELFLDVAAVVGLPVTAWQSGEPILAVLDIIAQVIAKLWNDGILPILSAPFLDYCFGDILTIVVLAIYGVERLNATFADGPGVVTNKSTINVYVFSAGDIRVKGLNGKFYKNRTTGALPAWDGVSAFPTVDLQFVAEEIGSGSTLVPSTLEVISGQIDLEVTHSAAWVGQDEERDEDLRARARAAAAANAWGGPKLAYVFAARSTKRPDGTTIPVTRLSKPTIPGDGTITYYMATPSGAVDPGDVAIVQANITDNVEPLCDTATMLSAVAKPYDVAATIYVRKELLKTSFDANQVGGNALAEFLRTAPIGGFKKNEAQVNGFIYTGEIEAVLSAADPSIYLVESPTPDLELLPIEVGVLNSLSLTVVQLSIAPV